MYVSSAIPERSCTKNDSWSLAAVENLLAKTRIWNGMNRTHLSIEGVKRHPHEGKQISLHAESIMAVGYSRKSRHSGIRTLISFFFWFLGWFFSVFLTFTHSQSYRNHTVLIGKNCYQRFYRWTLWDVISWLSEKNTLPLHFSDFELPKLSFLGFSRK